MPLTKIQFKPGINKEITLYANEGGFWLCDKVRFRSAYPEKLGGWTNYSPGNTFKGVARTLYNWVTYINENLVGMGTNQLYYVENGGIYYDITPIRQVNNLGNPFTTTNGSNLVQVTSLNHSALPGSFVTFSGASPVGGLTISGQYEIIVVIDANNFYILAASNASSGASGGGTVTATYKLNAGNSVYSTSPGGWGVGPWGLGGWGGAGSIVAGIPLILWSEQNWNQDLVFAQRTGPMYYWTKDTVNYTPAITINQYAGTQVKTSMTLGAAFGPGSSVITITNALQVDIGAIVSGTGIAPGTYVTTAYQGGLLVTLSQPTTANSDANPYTFSYSGNTAPNEVFQVVNGSTYQFLVAMGSTPYNPANFFPAFNPMLVRWSDQSNAAEWTPTSYNQSGEQVLANGSYIVGSVNTRQEILIWTDTSLYSMQYIGAPFVFGFTLLTDNIGTMSPNCMITIGGATYWMGTDKFYVYSGIVSTLPCTLRKFVFNNINLSQAYQVVAGFNKRFNEVWWFYPSANSNVNDSYIIFNYLENNWYYGTLNRTAWFDSALRPFPMGVFSIQQSYLSQAIGATDTSLSLLNGLSYPASGTVTIDSEQISYTMVSGNTLSGLTRGINGSVAASHLIYASVPLQIPNQLIYHENGVDDGSWLQTIGPKPINSYIESSDFDIADGDHFVFVKRMLPDIAFAGSTANSPQVMLTIMPRQNSGSPYQAGVDQPTVTSNATYPIELFTGEVFTRVRGRQMAFRIDSPNLGVQWQLGAMRVDVRPDGRR